MDESVRANIQDYLALAHEELENGALALAHARYRLCLSRAYYAAFYAASAMLLLQDIKRARHSGVEAALRQFFIKPGLLEEEYGDMYEELRSAREESDYALGFEPERSLAEANLESAQRFVARVEEHLRMAGFTPPAKP